MAENNPRKGRGAALLEALRKAQTVKPGESSEDSSSPQPPKPQGRARMLQKLAALKEARVGACSTITPDVTTTVESITETMASSQISEPCLYRGSSGKNVKVECNYINLAAELNKGVFEYNVKFEPQIDAKSVRGRLIHIHMGQVKMFDGGSILYLPLKLPDVTTSYDCTHPHNSSAIKMKVTFVKQKKLGECIHLFNILFKRIMRALLYSPIGRSYFDPHHSHMIPQHKLEVLPGYAIAVDEYESGVMICLDVMHRVMRTMSVLDVFAELRSTAREDFKSAAHKALIGASILTRYNNKTYRIDDILWNATPENTFETHDGKKISYIQYYKAQYDIDIVSSKQPLLVNMVSRMVPGHDKKVEQCICLVPELCYMTGLTDEMRADFKVMKDVAVYTRVTPNQRMNALRTFLENVEKTPQAKQILSDWGFKISKGVVDLMARILGPETILFGEGVTGYSENADWNALVTRNKVLGPVDLVQWCVLYTKRDAQLASEFGTTVVRLGAPMGMHIKKPQLIELKDDRTETYKQTIEKVIQPNIQILVFICPTARNDRYSTIKRICCAQMPIASQVINTRTLSNPKKVRGITQKIVLQMNCKLGGTLWSLRFPVTNWMVCGIDIYHSPGSKQSVCGFVSSLNESFTRWYSTVVFQDKELGDQLKMAFAKALEKYQAAMGFFPSNIVIFRDGVGDGQLRHSKEYEVGQFEQCLKDYQLVQTKLTVVVVQKRINTRIFLPQNQSLENPPPGTIVDSGITRRNWYDFFLIAQNVRQGTVTPSHYVVLHDTGKLKPDHVQKLAYKLCHLYYNWPGTIRVPAPCQYAHKLAYLVGQHVCRLPSTALSDRLYYL